VFPHHEMSASEATVATGEPFAQAYVHAGMVALDGEKMSKSKGNLELVSRLRDTGHDPMAIRLALLAHHYRSDWQWTDSDLTSGEQRLEAWRTAVARASTPPAADLVDRLREALADDLDAPAALAAVDAWAVADGSDESGGAAVRQAIDALLGVRL
jgi:L-cysteine:1D-myo-inositol 2-amino-2-deoxy-alpha-D-glucopyranoside ligase